MSRGARGAEGRGKGGGERESGRGRGKGRESGVLDSEGGGKRTSCEDWRGRNAKRRRDRRV